MSVDLPGKRRPCLVGVAAHRDHRRDFPGEELAHVPCGVRRDQCRYPANLDRLGDTYPAVRDLALKTSARSPTAARRIPSPMGLQQEFPVQRMRMKRFIVSNVGIRTTDRVRPPAAGRGGSGRQRPSPPHRPARARSSRAHLRLPRRRVLGLSGPPCRRPCG